MEYDNLDTADIVDIFQDLDTDLIEIFYRGQQAQLFQDIPPDEHDARIQQINQILMSSLRQPRARAYSTRNHNLYFGLLYIYWARGKIPLPCIHLVLAWNYINSLPIRRTLTRTIKFMTWLLVKVLQVLPWLYVTSCFLRDSLTIVFRISNIFTFSDNFLRDAITYVAKDYPHMLRRCEVIHGYNDFFYFMNNSRIYDQMSFLAVIKTIVYNYLCQSMLTTCMTGMGHGGLFEYGISFTSCKLNQDSLIFKFHNATVNAFPSLNETTTINSNIEVASSFKYHLLKAMTVIIYLTYAVGGNLFALNVLAIVSLALIRIVKKYSQFHKEMGIAVWNACKSPVI